MRGIFVGICNSQEAVPSGFFWSVVGLRSDVPVHFSRAVSKWGIIRNNQIIKNFLDSDFEYFVKMDVDQVYPADYFEKMVPLIDKYKVVGPLIFDRWRFNNFAPLVFDNMDQSQAYAVDIKGKSGVHPYPYFHTNCFYHREAIESIDPPWYEIRFSEDMMKVVENGDRFFIQKLVDAGYQPHINFDVVVQHITENGVDREFYERWNNKS